MKDEFSAALSLRSKPFSRLGRRLIAAFMLPVFILFLWHVIWLGILTRGTFHAEYSKLSGGDGLAVSVNPVTNLITVQATVRRNSFSLADPEDFLRKTADETQLAIHGRKSFSHNLKEQYDPYALTLPYRIHVPRTPLPYRLSTGESLQVWLISSAHSAQGRTCTLEYQTAQRTNDPAALLGESQSIWQEFHIYANKERCHEAVLTAVDPPPGRTPDQTSDRRTSMYKLTADGSWRSANHETP